MLGLVPTSSQRAHVSKELGMRAPNGWFLSSEGQPYWDFGEHLHWLIGVLLPKIEALRQLRELGWTTDISIGGASDGLFSFGLGIETMKTLVELGLPLNAMVFLELDSFDDV